jgi:hypothetical protein
MYTEKLIFKAEQNKTNVIHEAKQNYILYF